MFNISFEGGGGREFLGGRLLGIEMNEMGGCHELSSVS